MAEFKVSTQLRRVVQVLSEFVSVKSLAVILLTTGVYFVLFSSVPFLHQFRCYSQPSNGMYTLDFIGSNVHQVLHLPVETVYDDQFGSLDWAKSRDAIDVARPMIIHASDSLARQIINHRTTYVKIVWYRRGWQMLSAVAYTRPLSAPDTMALNIHELTSFNFRPEARAARALIRQGLDSTLYAQASTAESVAMRMGDLSTAYFSTSNEQERREEIDNFCQRLRTVVDSSIVFSADSLSDLIWTAAANHSRHPLTEQRMARMFQIGGGELLVGVWLVILAASRLRRRARQLDDQFIRRGCRIKRTSWLHCLAVSNDEAWMQRRRRFLLRLESDAHRQAAVQHKQERLAERERRLSEFQQLQEQQRQQELTTRLTTFIGLFPAGQLPVGYQTLLAKVSNTMLPTTERWHALWSVEEQQRRSMKPAVELRLPVEPIRSLAPQADAESETDDQRVYHLWDRLCTLEASTIKPEAQVRFISLRRRFETLPKSAPINLRIRILEQLEQLAVDFHAAFAPTNGHANGYLKSLDDLWQRFQDEVQPHLPTDICAKHLTAILLFGLMQPGRRGGIRSTNVYLKRESMLDNVRRKLKDDFNPEQLQASMAWLERQQLLIYHKLGNTVALNTHLHGRHGTLIIPEPTDVGREIIMILKRLNMDLMRATS